MHYNIKKLLAIIYLKTYSDAYEYHELKELLGLNITQLKIFIDNLASEKLIQDKNRLVLTDKSFNILKQMGLDNIDINSLMEEKITINLIENKLTFDDIYIPKDFKL